MGCILGVPSRESVLNGLANNESSKTSDVVEIDFVGPAVDIVVKSAKISVTAAANFSMLSGSSSSSTSVNDDALLGEIQKYSSEGRPLIYCDLALDMPKPPSMAATMSGVIDTTMTYNLAFGAPHPSDIPVTLSLTLPFQISSAVSFGFGTNLDQKAFGLEAISQAIVHNITQGYRPVAMIYSSASSQVAATSLTTSSAQISGSFKLLFQKMIGQPYSEMQLIGFPLNQKITMTGVVMEPAFDMLPVLNQWGASGWELGALYSLPIPPSGTMGIGSVITTHYIAVMIRRNTIPVRFMKLTQTFAIKISMSGNSFDGNISDKTALAARHGWGLVASVNLPAVQKGMTSTIPVQLYYSNAFGGYNNQIVQA